MSSFSAAFCRAADSLAGVRRKARLGLLRGLFQRREPLGAGIDQREIGGIALGERVERIDRRIVFAARGAQRKQPLLDPLQLLRIVIGDAQRVLEMRARLVERVERGVERLHGGLDQRRRLRAAPLQPPHRGRQRRHRRARARDRLVGIAQVARDLLGLHHAGAPVGERGLLAGLGLELAELVDRVAQPVGLARRALDVGAMLRDRVLGLAPRGPKPFDRRRIVLQPPIGVEQMAVGAGIDQRAGVVLAVDLDQRRAQRLQRLHADRLVVDEGAGAAVGELHAAQDQRLVGGDVALGQQLPRRMLRPAIRTSP